MPVTSVQFGQSPWKYANGLKISNDATTPDEIVDIAPGSILDSTGVFQIITDEVLSADNTVSGVGGLDTGSVAASTVYAIHIIADKTQNELPAALLSLSATAPLLPTGYNIFALVGYIVTDSSSDFLLGYWTAGDSARRLFLYDAPQATAVTAGAAVTYTNVDLSDFVPAQEDLPVWMAYDMTPSAAGRIMSLTPFNATGDAFSAVGQVSTVHVEGNALVLAQLNSGAPTIKYKWSAGGGDAVALNVAGYEWVL